MPEEPTPGTSKAPPAKAAPAPKKKVQIVLPKGAIAGKKTEEQVIMENILLQYEGNSM